MATLTSSEFFVENDYLKRYNNTNKKIVTIPDYITSIASLAFTNAKAIEIILPETIKSIQRKSFAFCQNLKYINIPEKIEYIPYDTFEGDIKLTNIDVSLQNPRYSSEDGIIYNKDKSIIHMVAPGLSGSITIKEGVKELGENAFRLGELITSINLNEELMSINDYAFKNTQIKSIRLGRNIKYITPNAFQDSNTLESITVDNDNPYFTSIDGVLYSKDLKTLIFVPNGKVGNLIIPDTVENIKSDGFYNKQISSIYMPKNCNEVIKPKKEEDSGRTLFENTPNLKEIIFSNKKFTINQSLFSDKESFINIIKYAYPSQLKFSDKLVYLKYIIPHLQSSDNEEWKKEWAKFIKRNIKKFYEEISDNIKICKTLCSIKAISLDDIREITKLSEDKKNIEVTSILLEYQNNNFTTEDVMNSTFDALNIDVESKKYLQNFFNFHKKEDGTYVITGYKGNDTTVYVPSTIDGISVTEISRRAFSPYKAGLKDKDRERLSSITSITVPSTVKKIHSEAFYKCTNLDTLTLNYGLEEIYNEKPIEYSFIEGTNIRELEIPGPITSLPPHLFNNCRISKLKLSDTIKEIGEYCFHNCYYLEEINLPPITRIEKSTFNGCSGLKHLVIPDTVSFFGTKCFAYCMQLTAEVGDVVHKYEKEINYYAPSFQFACKEHGRVWRTCERLNIKHVPR